MLKFKKYIISIYHMSQEKVKMKLISVHIPEWMLEEIDKLVQSGLYPSRSEFIRIAIHQLLIQIWNSQNKNSIKLYLGR